MYRKNKLILITGALGQDGIILSKILLKNKYRVIGWIKKNSKYRKKIKKIKYNQVNLSNKNIVSEKLKKIKPDFVVHFGSDNPSFKERYSKIKNFNEKNIKNSINLIDSIIKLNLDTTFLFASSSQIFVYKTSNKYVVNELGKFKKKNGYIGFKIKIYEYLKSRKKEIKFINLIFFNHDSKYRNKKFLLPRIISAFKKRNFQFIKKIYKENIIADLSHAEDICKAIYLVIKKNIVTDNLILSSGKKTKINDIIQYLINKTKSNVSLRDVKILNPKFIIGNNNKAKTILKWRLKKNIYNAVDEIYNN